MKSYSYWSHQILGMMKNILIKFMLSSLTVILMELVLWVEASLESGVQTRMKERQISLIHKYCTAHQLELAVRDSTKYDNYLDRFDEIINIFKFYYHSPLCRKELNDLALLFDENFKQFGLLRNIRWLASRFRLAFF